MKRGERRKSAPGVGGTGRADTDCVTRSFTSRRRGPKESMAARLRVERQESQSAFRAEVANPGGDAQ